MVKKSMSKKQKVFVAMSGGVDSSVAAFLIQHSSEPNLGSQKKVRFGERAGQYDLVGCFITGWYPEGVSCSWKEDRRDAMKVCAKLGIPFVTIDAEKEYKKKVVDYMIREYKAGRTPNPDVMCNKNVKFGVFLDKAKKMGADFIATGHYVQLQCELLNKSGIKPPSHRGVPEGRGVKICKLKIAKDTNKDQSYFLWTLTQKQLKHCLFPLGDLTKPEVRKIAEKAGLVTAQKAESQGVCFIGEFKMADFLKKYIKQKKGEVVTQDGKLIGEHEGLAFYTIGQRHGFGSPKLPVGSEGSPRKDTTPYYVVQKDFKKNRLIVADQIHEKDFYKKEVEIENVNWIGGETPDFKKIYLARVRYRQPLQECKISLHYSRFIIRFVNPQRAVTSGQSLVIYTKAGEMLGGGIIK